MLRFQKSEKNNNEKNIVEQIQKFAPMIKTFTSFDIESIVPMLMSSMAGCKNKTGSDVVIALSCDGEKMFLDICLKNNATMVSLHRSVISSTYGAIDEINKGFDFLKQIANGPTININGNGQYKASESE